MGWLITVYFKSGTMPVDSETVLSDFESIDWHLGAHKEETISYVTITRVD